MHPPINSRLFLKLSLSLLLTVLLTTSPSISHPVVNAQSSSVHFAVFGDYGYQGQPEADVAALVKTWNPQFIVTTGDNNYGGSVGGATFPPGSSETIDANIGQYYQEFIYPYAGTYGGGGTSNLFYPIMGNHDWDTTNGQAYFDYFSLPNNERYYDFVQGPIHFFVLDSDSREPDGNTSTSVQGEWLRNALASSSEPWKLVILHHAPYSSGEHGSNAALQWPFQAWGANAVIAGHDHTYERIIQNNFPYFVNGLGGRSIYNFGTPITGSMVRYNSDYGAMLVDASSSSITFQFINRSGDVIDSYTLHKTSQLIFRSVGIYDGWVLESSETSNKGGSMNSTSTIFVLGDAAGDKQYKSILHFNTATLPDTAVVTSITLKIKKYGLVGTNPFATHGPLLVDIRKPSFGTAVLALADFQAGASQLSATSFNSTPVSGWYSALFTSTSSPYINLTGTTQFRLGFTLDDNDDMNADYMKFFSGNYSTTSLRPKLTIQYYVP